MKASTVCSSGEPSQEQQGSRKNCLNSELWHACAGPLVSLPNSGTRVLYFPQGHSEQVVASTNKEVEGHIPNYPNLPPQFICYLHNVTMHADTDTDEVYAQMTLQPLSAEEQKDNYLPIEIGIQTKQPMNYFCKTLTASDTSTHGGFSVPRRAAEKVFPPLDFTMQPPAQELIARDLHDVEWKFRHIFRGQPKRHLLTTGWSVFVSAKKLIAGDSVLFIWNENNQLLLGIRRANRTQTSMPSSVISSDSMHMGLLAAAAHAIPTDSQFTIFYNPRVSPSEFVIPLSKYVKSVFHTRISIGMRFRMLFETEESSVRRYMGTITDIGDLDPVRWPNSHWRSVKVGWDESTTGYRQPRVSLWEIEPLTTFPMYPSLFPLRLKRPWYPGASSLQDDGNSLMWLRGETGDHDLQALGMSQWMQRTVEPPMLNIEHNYYQEMAAAALQDIRSSDGLKQQFLQQHPLQFTHQGLTNSDNNQVPLQQIIPQAHQLRQISSNLQLHGITENNHSCNSPHPTFLQSFPEHANQQVQMQQVYHESFQIPNNQIQQKTVFPDATTNFSQASNPIQQNMMATLLKFSKSSPPSSIMNDPTFTTNSVSLTPEITEHGNIDPQNHTLFGVNLDNQSPLITGPMPSLAITSSLKNNVNGNGSGSTLPYGNSCFQNNMYGCTDESPSLLHSVDKTETFVKVYKSGSVGRSLDITRFNDYNELREELGQMYGIEGLLEDPLRSGWQLVFVDRENDVLLLGDDPWESFVNNVWYIKILSPEDVHKMGKQCFESFS